MYEQVAQFMAENEEATWERNNGKNLSLNI